MTAQDGSSAEIRLTPRMAPQVPHSGGVSGEKGRHPCLIKSLPFPKPVKPAGESPASTRSTHIAL